MKPISFVIVGSGWRAMFFVRIAKRFPELFQLKYMLCRTEEKAARLRLEEQIPTTTSEEACEAAKPDFVVVAVSKGENYEVTRRWAVKGFPVLAETPVGCSVEELTDLWELVQNHGARIQVAEQYCRYPIMAAGLKAVREGKLGEPYNVTLSVAHDYHGFSLIRHILFGCGVDGQLPLEKVKMTAKQYSYPVRETDSRFGPITDGSVQEKTRAVATLEFASGKTAWYDFSGVQYHSFIRARHLNVQGRDGEWNDTMLRYVDEQYLPVAEKVKPYLAPKYSALNTEEILREADIWKSDLVLSNAQDEYAIASMLLDMRAYIEEGKEVYPLAEAIEDAYLLILLEQALANPETVVESEAMPWREQG